MKVMRSKYVKKVWLLVGMSIISAIERPLAMPPAPIEPPPPAVPSPYFTSSSSNENFARPASEERNSIQEIPQPATPFSQPPMPAGEPMFDSRPTNIPEMNERMPMERENDMPYAPRMASNFESEPRMPEMNQMNDFRPEENSMDASTGIQGAHVVSGINFKDEHTAQESLEGVDTTHVKHVNGNWVEKKHYWYEIQHVVDEIKEKIADIMAQRMNFFTLREEVDKELSTFYQHVGMDHGPLQDMIHYALEIIEKVKNQQGFLNRKERAFYDKIQSKQRVFEQLKEDVKAINTIDVKIDEALEVLLKQINTCNEYEDEVWNIYKTVGYELSEKDAEQSYLNAKAYLKDVENIQMYLSSSFNSYFQELAQSLQTHTQNIVMQLDGLEKEGIELKKEAAIFEGKEEASHAHIPAASTAKHQEIKEDKKEQMSVHHVHSVPTHEKKSWTDSVKHFFKMIISPFTMIYQTVKGLFVKSELKVKAPHDAIKHEHTTEVKNTEVATDIKNDLNYNEQHFKQELEGLAATLKDGLEDVAHVPEEIAHKFETKL